MTTSTATTATKPAPKRTAAKAAPVKAAQEVEAQPSLATAVFVLAKETKGAVRYNEVLEDGQEEALIGSVYLRKTHLGGKVPSAIRVTVEDLTAKA